MERQDKRLIALATALIILAIVWFAQFSSRRQAVMNADTLIQILDTDKGRRTAPVNPCSATIRSPAAHQSA